MTNGYLLITANGAGCTCNVGYSTSFQHKLTVGPGCDQLHVMEHELGHALGFWHEQMRPDRDSYIKVNYQNFDRIYDMAFEKYGRDKVESFGLPYDYTSIMHYPWDAFSNRYESDGRTIAKTSVPLRTVPSPGPYRRISPHDITAVKMHYKCEGGDNSCRDSAEQASECKGWADQGYCTEGEWVDWMKTNCKKSCKSCEGDKEEKCKDKKGGCEDKKEQCKDKKKSCSKKKKKGQCSSKKSKKKSWMKKNCPKSCGFCDESERDDNKDNDKDKDNKSCTDNHENCQYWKTKGYCTSDEWGEYMSKTCCKTCKDGGGSRCTDDHENCSSWANAGYCSGEHQEYMTKNCCKSCK